VSEVQATGEEREDRRARRLAPGQPAPRILVADDVMENRLLLTKLLGPFGFEVREAEDGRAALAAWESWRPDLVFLDIQMPELDGYEVARQVRAAEGPRSASVIVALTASAFEHERAAILASGCDEFVAKPFLESTIVEL